MRAQVSMLRAGSVLGSLVLAGIGTAYVGSATAGASCGLPVGEQIKAVKAFAEMLPVFRHPRCMNCHGGLDPMSDLHPGKDQVADADPNDRKAYLTVCEGCHDGLARGHDDLPAWRIPGSPVFFVGKNDEELCTQMKRFEKSGELFVEHIRNDHGDIQFIDAGFKGDRALGEGLKDYHLAVQKPPGTQAELTSQAQRWVDILKQHYEESPDCGCVMPKIKLKVNHTMDENLPQGLPSREWSKVEFEVELLPLGEDKPGAYQGEVSLVRNVQRTVPQYCKPAGASIKERWMFWATLAPDSDSLKLWHALFPSETEQEIECQMSQTGGWGGRRGPKGSSWVKFEDEFDSSILGYGEPFDMPSKSGSTREFRDNDGAHSEFLSITVEDTPQEEPNGSASAGSH